MAHAVVHEWHNRSVERQQPIGQAESACMCSRRGAAYLVRSGDREGVLRAVREACTRWAGATEPIIPVPGSGVIDPWWQQLLETSRVDGLVNVNVPERAVRDLQSLSKLESIEIAEIDHKGRTRWSTNPANLLPDGRTRLSEELTIAGSGGDLWERIAVGDYYPDRLAETSQPHLPRTVHPSNIEGVLTAQLNRTSWLDLGTAHFGEHQTTGGFSPSPALIWVTDPNDLEGCLYYWNLRALRSHTMNPTVMLLIPLGCQFDWLEVSEVLAEHLRRPVDLEPDAIIGSVRIEDDVLNGVGRRLGLIDSTSPPRSTVVLGGAAPPIRAGPHTFSTRYGVRSFLTFLRKYGIGARTTVQVYARDTSIDVESPVKFRGPGSFLMRFTSTAFDGLPQRPASAALVHPDAIWSNDRLEVPYYAGGSSSYQPLCPNAPRGCVGTP